ncbi:MAG: sigma-54 dependent transcriptional regulator [Candidatus Abyssubacteria bacterium]
MLNVENREILETIDSSGKGILRGANVLVVDDDVRVTRLVAATLHKEGARVETVSSGEEALRLLANSRYDLAITDVRMPGMDGLELMDRLRRQNAHIETIIITAYADIPLAVRAMKEGAYDFISKPFHLTQLITAAERALEKQAMKREIDELRSQVQRKDSFESLIGRSQAMHRVYERIAQVAPTESTVLVQGETGTGKELVARAIHAISPRAKGPFITINCGSLTQSLLEGELFGHVKGAFTGATSNKMGLFEAAAGGTIFLDEIDSTSQHTQLGLLRVLEDKQVRPVGAVSTRTVDARVVCSAQRDLSKLKDEGLFREDLYYRMTALTIALPPLRERMDDLPLLIEHFARLACEKSSKQPCRFSTRAMDALMRHSWPGNVRELKNTIERAVLFAAGPIIEDYELNIAARDDALNSRLHTIMTLDELERQHILRVLSLTGNNKRRASQILGIPRTTLYQRMKKHDISSDTIRDYLLCHREAR